MPERSDIYQHRNIHIDDRCLKEIHISNSENSFYLHNAHGTEDSINETNMKQTKVDIANSDDNYSEADNSEASSATKVSVLDSAASDIYNFSIHISSWKRKNFCVQYVPCRIPLFSHVFLWEIKTIK